jgi:cyclohexanone monooxygenase
MENYTREAGFEVIGRDGVALSRHWTEGPLTLCGVQTSGFPNFFMISLAQAGVSFNYMHIAEEQAKHIGSLVRRCLDEGISSIEPTAEAEAAWVGDILANSGARRAFYDSCTPSYTNAEGRRDRAFDLIGAYPRGPMAYIDHLERWRDDPTMPGMWVERWPR